MAIRKRAAAPNGGKTPSPDTARKPARATGKSPARFKMGATVSLPALLDGPQGSDERFRQMLYDLSTAATHLESARAYLAAKLGLTPPQYNMLMVIAQFQGEIGLSVSQVAAHLHVSTTFITSEVNKLVSFGLVTKLPNPDDARSVLLRLTEVAEGRVAALEGDLHFVNDQLFRDLGAADFKALSRIIANLIPGFERTAAMLGALVAHAENPAHPRASGARRRGSARA